MALVLVEWIYPRPEGDIVVFATSKEQAAEIIRRHGFEVSRPNTIKRGETVITDNLKRNPID